MQFGPLDQQIEGWDCIQLLLYSHNNNCTGSQFTRIWLLVNFGVRCCWHFTFSFLCVAKRWWKFVAHTLRTFICELQNIRPIHTVVHPADSALLKPNRPRPCRNCAMRFFFSQSCFFRRIRYLERIVCLDLDIQMKYKIYIELLHEVLKHHISNICQSTRAAPCWLQEDFDNKKHFDLAIHFQELSFFLKKCFV